MPSQEYVAQIGNLIYNLEEQPSVFEDISEVYDIPMECHNCGGEPKWFVGILYSDGDIFDSPKGRRDMLYCSDCIPSIYVEEWENYPWSPMN